MTRTLRFTVLSVGIAFGFFLTSSGLGDYRTIHRGLLLKSDYIFLMMACAVGIGAAGIALLRMRSTTVFGAELNLPRHPVSRSSLLGGAVFGVGFAVGASCPGITVAMVATGGMYGAVVLGGILLGLWLRGRVEEVQSLRATDPGVRSNVGTAVATLPAK